MQGDFPGDGPMNVWRNQPREKSKMTLRLMQRKSRDYRATTRKKLMGTLAGPLATGLLYVLGMRTFVSLRQLLQPLFAFALVWSLVGLYFMTRSMWSAAMPADAGLSSGLEFCRKEVERQRDLLRRALLWSFGPVLLAIGTFILGLLMAGTKDRGIIPNGLPFLILVLVWIVAYFIVRLREKRALQRQFDELNEIERENRSE